MLHIETLPLGSYQTNCYIVYGDASSECIVIDPGYEPGRVLAEVAELGKQVCAILLTHGHFDHVGGVRSIAERTGCPVYIHENELTLPESFTAGPLFYTCTYAEGDVLSLAGVTFRVLHTPGHTPGSVCLVTEDTIFSGDTLFMDSIGRTDFPGGNTAEIFRSLKRLTALETDYTVLPGHGDKTTLFAEKQYNPYLR